jgi:alpha-glucosidase
MLALPGSAYVYAGDELGLPQAAVPDDAKRDPIFFRSHGARAGRDGCRVPMPWNASAGVGFSPPTRSGPGCRSRRTGTALPCPVRTGTAARR